MLTVLETNAQWDVGLSGKQLICLTLANWKKSEINRSLNNRIFLGADYGLASCGNQPWSSLHTGGPLLTKFSLLRIPLPQFLAYVRASGGFLR